MRDVLADLVFAFRSFRRSPGFYAVAVVALVGGIAASTAVFSVVNALLSIQIPLTDPQRVTFLFSENLERSVSQSTVSLADFLDWREQARSFQHLVAAEGRDYNFQAGGEPRRVQAFQLTDGFFALTGLPLELGRGFSRDETRNGFHRVVVLSHAFWRQELEAEEQVVGREIRLDGAAYVIVGVAGESTFFPTRDVELWTPLITDAGAAPRDVRALTVIGRLREDVSVEEAHAEINTIAGRLALGYPATNQNWTALVMTVRDNFRQSAALATVVLYGSVTFVLLIACANVASLMLSRAMAREKEIALRVGLGAGRWRVIRQLLTESVLLSGISGALGTALGFWGIRYLANMLRAAPNAAFIADGITMNGAVLWHALAISIGSGLLFGTVPALGLSKPDLQSVLKEGGRGSPGGPSGRWLRPTLVAAEITLALALLATTGAMIRMFNHLFHADPRFNPKGLLTLEIDLPEADYPGSTEVRVFSERLLDQVQQIAGVESGATASALPLTLYIQGPTAVFTVQGAETAVDERPPPNAIDIVVGGDYFESLQIPMLRGRAFGGQDRHGSLPVAIASRAFAERFWPNADPIGRLVKMGASDSLEPWLTVIGVAENTQSAAHSIRQPVANIPQVYRAQTQSPLRSMSVALRTQGDPLALAADARRAVWSIDARLPVENVYTMEGLIRRTDTQTTFSMRIVTVLAMIATIIAAIGIYGVIAYSVQQRTPEIGIRMALGASSRDLVTLVARQAALLTGVGLVIGLAMAWGFVQLLSTQLEGFRTSNAGGPLTFVVVAGVLLLVAQIASFLPARRATRVDPLAALRQE